MGPLLAPLGAQGEQQEPDAGELLKRALANISTFNTDRFVYAKKQEVTKFIPAGQEVKVYVSYRVYNPVPAEDLNFSILDDVRPFPSKYLTEKGVQYREEETTITGTGTYVKQGAPVFPELSSNPQVGWIEWNQWHESSQKWVAKHRTEVSMRPAPENVIHEAMPQLSPDWLEENQKLLGLFTEQLRQRPDLALSGAAEVLRELNARSTGPWSPPPGGVLLSAAVAGKLGDGLTIDKVEYVPGSAEVKVTGRTSAMGLDADLLATTLRLALRYEQIPYFSLDPHEWSGDDWVAARDGINQEVNRRLRQGSAFAKRVRQNAFEVADHAGQRHLVTYLDQVDPALSASASKRMPMNMDLVFRPKWLKRTRLGEMLFIADQSLKELWHGAAVWTHGHSRLTVGTHVAPKFWSEQAASKEHFKELLHRSISTSSTLTRWWFSPGGQIGQTEHVLDLSQVQPMLQTERMGGKGKASRDLDLGQKDPWSKAVVEEVNQHFESYAQAFPEWEGLRQVFRAYVFAIWLVKHDPDMSRDLLAQLPPPRPPSKPLPDIWPDPQILTVLLGPGTGVKIEQGTIVGGVGFEQNLLKWGVGSTSGGSLGIVSRFPSVVGFAPNPIDDDAPATSEGYRAWRGDLLKERGYLWGWIRARLSLGEVATFAGIALAIVLVTFWDERKQKVPFSHFEAGAMTVDWLVTTLIFTLIALHPDVYKDHTAPFTGWWRGVITCAVMLFHLPRRLRKGDHTKTADRFVRFSFMLVIMLVCLIETAFTPGLGEIVRGLTPLHLAVPSLSATWGSLPVETVYSLEALKEGLTLCRSAEPRYAFYPLLVLLVLVGLWFELKVNYLGVLGHKKAASA